MNTTERIERQRSAGAQAHGLLSSMLEHGQIPAQHLDTARRIVAAWPAPEAVYPAREPQTDLSSHESEAAAAALRG